MAVPSGRHVKKKEYEQLDYSGLKEELERMWKPSPLLVGALGIFNKGYCKCSVFPNLCGLGKRAESLEVIRLKPWCLGFCF